MNEKQFAIICCDCGADVTGTGEKPKDVAKKFSYFYAGKGKWRCKECQEFLDNEKAKEE